ncbi:MAG: hypothetical protein M0Q42_02050 [Xanthomonadales bacterium]|nr:hypothetical protein [Xanthomonadales bacterium]
MNRHLTTLGLALALLAWALPGQAAVVEPGHSALWYDTARDGEGLLLEINSPDDALLTWYTWDEDGNQRWLIGEGTIVRDDEVGEYIEFPELIVTRGGRFGADFDPDQVERTVAGSATLVFQDCYEGQFSYDAFEQQGELALHRLTHTMGAGCRPIHGRPGDPVYGHAGQSGAWFDESHDGEGWFLQWLAHNEAVLTWFTYDAAGNQAWMLGTGTLDDDGTLVFEQLQGTRGARFGAGFDADHVERFDWGRLELAIGCDTGSARYDSLLPEFGAGEYDMIERLSALAAPAACPWVAPTLTDLYDIQVTELPVTPEVKTSPPLPGSPGLIFVTDVADDGTIAGIRRDSHPDLDESYTLVVLRTDEEEWTPAHDGRVRGKPRLSADGNRLLFQNADRRLTILQDGELVPVQGLEGSFEDVVVDATDDLAMILGRSRGIGLSSDWLGGPGQPAVELPEPELESAPAYASCLSNDGSVIIGSSVPNFSPGSPAWTLRWLDGQVPQVLLDAQDRPLADHGACSSDGQVVFGSLVVDGDGSPDEWPRLPGFIRGDGVSGYLDLVHDREQWHHSFHATSADGSLMAGSYSWRGSGEPDEGVLPLRAFLWTQDTGEVLLTEWLQEADLLADWPQMSPVAVSPNGEYLLVTTHEIVQSDLPGMPSYVRSALIRLTPK